MALDMSASNAPAGDVTAAILELDSTLKRINGTATGSTAGLSDALVSSPAEAAGLLDGFCTLLYLFITAFRKACEDPAKTCSPRQCPWWWARCGP